VGGGFRLLAQLVDPLPAGTYSGTVKQNGPTLVTHDNQGDRTLVVQPGATVNRPGACSCTIRPTRSCSASSATAATPTTAIW